MNLETNGIFTTQWHRYVFCIPWAKQTKDARKANTLLSLAVMWRPQKQHIEQCDCHNGQPIHQKPFSEVLRKANNMGRMLEGPQCLPWSQQGLLATYLIPGCVGRGVRLGSESSSGGGGVWKSGNHEIWSEMGPYGSIWLDTAAKMIVRTLRIFFVFKKSLKIGLGVKKRGPWLPKKCLGVQKRGPWLKKKWFCFSKIWNFQNFKIHPFRMSSY